MVYYCCNCENLPFKNSNMINECIATSLIPAIGCSVKWQVHECVPFRRRAACSAHPCSVFCTPGGH